MLIICDQCGKDFNKSLSQIKKTKHNFCSQSCSIIFTNLSVKRSSLPDREVQCIDCKILIKIKANASTNQARCLNCKKIRGRVDSNGNLIYLYKEVICAYCHKNKFFTISDKKYCDDCLPIVQKNNGLKSAKSQSRRSKNEIYFSELCEKDFNKISTNDCIFKSKYGNWDADIIIFDYKIAVLWNGVWHYQQVRKDHSLKQVQARDKIKIDVIKDNGYIPYIIKDMGKYNTKFVEEEFVKLKIFINELNV